MCKSFGKIVLAILYFNWFTIILASQADIIELDNLGSRQRLPKLPKIKSLHNQDQEVDELSNEQYQQIKDILHERPNFTEFQASVLRFASIPSDRDFQRYHRQARLRNLLPILRSDLKYSRDKNLSYSQDHDDLFTEQNPSVNDPNDLPTATYNHRDLNFYNNNSRDNSRDLSFGIDLVFDLPGAVYDNENTDIISEQRRFTPIKSDFIDRAFEAYHDRRNKQILLITSPPKNRYEKTIREVELQDLTDQLDSLTGGWFSQQLLIHQKAKL